jgi:hypothetical protein
VIHIQHRSVEHGSPLRHDGSLYTAEQIHNTNLASLNWEYCRVKSTRQVRAQIGGELDDDS